VVSNNSDDDDDDDDDDDGCNDVIYVAEFLLNRESHRWPINFPPFMKVESTFVCSQDPATDSRLKTVKSSQLHPSLPISSR
jgi:hypothetical protein